MRGLSEIGGTATVKNGHLIIDLPLKNTPKPSSTGKTLIVAGTDGAAESTLKVKVDGADAERAVILNVNAYVYATEK